ncbi:hypothetical protein ACCO45_003285 [Purpureocillium lilacinum]|uniref:Uncharacterized protein n=1 Tax=Purpureocillium lilacinum TaxID=33203 RepID=A0ACC4DZI0_PURLI
MPNAPVASRHQESGCIVHDESDSSLGDDYSEAQCLYHGAPQPHLDQQLPPYDDDLDMSDSDGGAPLDDILVAMDVGDGPVHSEPELETHAADFADDDDDAADADDMFGASEDAHDQPPALPDFYLNMHMPPFPYNIHPDGQQPDNIWPFPILDFDDAPPPAMADPGLENFPRSSVTRTQASLDLRTSAWSTFYATGQAHAEIKRVIYAGLKGDECDFQGLDWAAMGTTRDAARVARLNSYRNYVNRPGSDRWTLPSESPKIPARDSFFRFKTMDIRPDASLAHFQLRSVLACPSRTLAFYPSPNGISRLNLRSKKTDLIVNTREFPATGGVISTLDANCGVLMGGTFNGDYCLKALDSEEKNAFSEGQISPDGITNHLRIHTSRRNARPIASIASNDRGLRVMDIETETFVSRKMYPFCLNCSANSPDRRLQVVVGDDPNVLIVNADTGEILQELTGHGDYGFACDWSDDGWTVATGFQDKAIKIWDARKWCNSSGVSTALCTIRAEMAGVRGLRFSPRGSGKPILVAAEEADYINLIDAQTFSSKQTIDVFSEVGGIDFTNDGQDLNVLCCDPHRGGVLQLERCGRGPDVSLENAWLRRSTRYPWLVDRDEECELQQRWSRGRVPTLLEGPEPF